MAKEQAIILSGVVTKCLPNEQFTVMLDEHAISCTATLGGRLRKFQIRVLQGDRVDLEMNSYDPTKGRIVMRHKNVR